MSRSSFGCAVAVILVAGAAVVGGCSNDDGSQGGEVTASPPGGAPSATSATTTVAASATVVVPASATVPVTVSTTPVEPVTTVAPTVTTAAPPSTLVAGGSAADEALAAQVAADYAAGLQRMRVLEAAPTLDDLDARVAEFAAPDSPFHAQIKAVVESLIAEGRLIVLNDPPVDTLTVERVRFRGEPPYEVAEVLVCEGNNLREITPAANSPTGADEVHVEVGVLALRRWMILVTTPDGWMRYDDGADFVEAFDGQASCVAN